jgi:hypothetical protein
MPAQEESQRPRRAKRQPVSIRFEPGLRDRVWNAAVMENKSLNDMVNILIKRGLEANRYQGEIFGSAAGFAVAKALINAAEVSVLRQGGNQGFWLYDREAFKQARVAMNRVLDTMEPDPAVREALAVVEEGRRATGGRK